MFWGLQLHLSSKDSDHALAVRHIAIPDVDAGKELAEGWNTSNLLVKACEMGHLECARALIGKTTYWLVLFSDTIIDYSFAVCKVIIFSLKVC